MFIIDYRELSWWYWLVTACLLTAGVAGWETGFVLAIGLTVVQLVHFTLREGSPTAFPVQVRFWYLMLLLVALPQPLQWVYWVPTIGTWAQLLFGYCTMARCVSLLPWNRASPSRPDSSRARSSPARCRATSCRGCGGPRNRVDHTPTRYRDLLAGFIRLGPLALLRLFGAVRACETTILQPA